MSVKGVILRARYGRSLRHRPIVWPGPGQVRVEATFAGNASRVDVTDGHVPMGLSPFIIGLRLDIAAPLPKTARLFFTDTKTGLALGSIVMRASSEITEGQLRLGLFTPTATRNKTARWLTRAWRYYLAYQQVRATRRQPGIRMTAHDAIALNLYYATPRPVFLIGVSHNGAKSFLPRDLRSTIDWHQILALRAASVSSTAIAESRVIAMSAAPADSLDAVYKCGKWNLGPSADLAEYPLKIRFLESGCPALDDGGEVRQVRITHVSHPGSHSTFIGSVLSREGSTSRQLAHVSGMYSEWLDARHQALETLTAE